MGKKVLLAKKDCIEFLWAPLNDQYTDGSIWSIDDKDRCRGSLMQKETSKLGLLSGVLLPIFWMRDRGVNKVYSAALSLRYEQ